MRILRVGTNEFTEKWSSLLRRRERLVDELSAEVESQLQQYRSEREQFLMDAALKYDNLTLTEDSLWVEWDQIKKSHKQISPEVRQAIDHAKDRIERFQVALKLPSFQAEEEAGVFWGTEIRPLESVGIYIPGGSSNYFMTLLLCAVPAKMANVKEIVIATPPKKKLGPPYVDATLLYAAKLFEIQKILLAGSVGALAALAFGTKHSSPVEKIVGSGNRRTAVAKLRLAGFVGTDGLSGPLETAFVCDETSEIKSIAADIVGKADGDPEAEIFLFHHDETWIKSLLNELVETLGRMTMKDGMSEKGSIQKCLERNTNFFLVDNFDQGLKLVNQLAPGILCLPVENASDHLEKVRACGSVLLGNFTPPVGMDLVGGPSGLVTTLGSAAYSVSMSPASFVRRFTVMEFDKMALLRFEKEAVKLAQEEGFRTHEASYRSRFEESDTHDNHPSQDKKKAR